MEIYVLITRASVSLQLLESSLLVRLEKKMFEL